MQISGIISISGQPGLYKVVAKTRNGVIAESLIDKKRIPVYANHKVSALEDISIFTTKDDISLAEVFKKIYDKESGGPSLDSKADIDSMKKHFGEVLPEYDKDRVHNSDIKKVYSWYGILQGHGLLEPAKEEEVKDGEEKKILAKEDKPKAAPKARKKDTAEGKPIVKSAAKSKPTIRKTGA